MWGAFVQNLKEGESGDMAEGERERGDREKERNSSGKTE
jgi:hypothetical protein